MKIDFKKRCQILGVLLIYLTVVSAHIFYLPSTTASVTTCSYNSVFKRKIENIRSLNRLERTDKATFKETIKSTSSDMPLVNLNFLFTQPKVHDTHAASSFLKARSFHNLRYSYISICTFRI